MILPTLLCRPSWNHVTPFLHYPRLPRPGDQPGHITRHPGRPTLYGWLDAFNQASNTALGNALSDVALASAVIAQIKLR